MGFSSGSVTASGSLAASGALPKPFVAPQAGRNMMSQAHLAELGRLSAAAVAEARAGEYQSDRERIETLSPVIVQACVRAVFVSLFLVALCQVNYELWHDYAGMSLWAFVISEALRKSRKNYIKGLKSLVEELKREERSERSAARGTPRSNRGLLYWLLSSLGLPLCAEITLKVRRGIGRGEETSLPAHAASVVWEVVAKGVREKLDQDNDGTVSLGACPAPAAASPSSP